MATQYSSITKANFSTTPYNYQVSGNNYNADTWYWFYKSNVCWDVYIKCAIREWIRIDFYDYDANSWIPFKSTIGTYSGQQYMWMVDYNVEPRYIFRFFHNCDTNYNNSAYTAGVKVKDNTSLSYNNNTYDTRGYSLWRIGFCFASNSANNDFNINSYGPGYLTDSEYNTVCKGKLIFCGGKGTQNSDDQHIVSGTPSDSDFNTKFLPSLFSDGNHPIYSYLDRQCIPDWKWAKT